MPEYNEIRMIGELDARRAAGAVPVPVGRGRGWQSWAPYAAVAWSLGYAALGVYWALGGGGFPYGPQIGSGILGPVVGRLGPAAAWVVVALAGLPAAALGTAMLRGVRGRVLRPVIILAGTLLAGILMLLMTDINLLIQLGYLPYGIIKFLMGAEFGQAYLKAFLQWPLLHQLLCLAGGFLWLGATVSYARRSGDACLYCGRRDGPEGWTSPDLAARWGRIAVYAAMAVPVFYAVTRYAWALGIPLGMSEEALRSGQERGMWISGLSLATFGLVGAVLILGLAQRWGEVFPRWMIGLAGRRVPIGLAVVPAAVMSVLLAVGGLTILFSYGQMSAAAEAAGYSMAVIVGPVTLFPFWGAALAAAALGYYYRRRGPCEVCGRGGPRRTDEPLPGRVLPAAGGLE